MLRDSSRPLLDHRRSRLPYLRSGPGVMQGHVHKSLAGSARDWKPFLAAAHFSLVNDLLRQCQQTIACDTELQTRNSLDADMA